MDRTQPAMTTEQTRAVVEGYHRAWTSQAFDEAGRFLAPDLAVEAPINRYDDAVQFLSALRQFGQLVKRVDLRSQLFEGDQAMLLYDLEVESLGGLRVAEHFTVSEGRIRRLRQIHDTAALRAAGFDQAAPGRVRAVADPADGDILASVEVPAAPDRVFRALASREVVDWWVRPGVFDTREWTGEPRVGGRWRASGVGRGSPYALEGEFLQVDPNRKLVHTWHGVGSPARPTTVTYRLDAVGGRTLVTLRHSGFTSPDVCANTCVGWETSFERLAELLASEVRAG